MQRLINPLLRRVHRIIDLATEYLHQLVTDYRRQFQPETYQRGGGNIRLCFAVRDPAYFCEINRLRKKYSSLTLLSGIEFSEPHLFPHEFAKYCAYPFDCITAGIHHCNNAAFPGARNLPVTEALDEYYNIMLKTIELGGFQVLAHLDFPRLFFDSWEIDSGLLDNRQQQSFEFYYP